MQLVERLDREFSWRRTEFIFIKSLVSKSNGLDEITAIRASVPLLYAHWEGFVKKAACHYTDFLSAQRITYRQAKESFSGLKAHSYVMSIADIRKRIFTPSLLLKQIDAIGSERVDVRLSSYIENVGNLTFDLFEQILLFLSIDTIHYMPFKKLIDDSLLFHRNKIAHGEQLEIDASRYISLHDDVVNILAIVKNDIETAAINKDFRR